MPDLLERLQKFEQPDLSERMAAFEQAPAAPQPQDELFSSGDLYVPGYMGVDKEVQIRLPITGEKVEPYEYQMYSRAIREMAEDLSSSRATRPVKVRDYVRKLPQRLWPVLEEETRRLSRDSAKYRKEGITLRTLKGLAQGMVQTGENLQRMTGMDSLDPAQSEAARNLLAASEGIDPLIPQQWKWYDPRKWVVSAAQMAYPAATGMVGMAAAPGAVAAHAVGGGYWFTQIFPDRYDEYKSEGMADNLATPAAVLSSVLEGAIETFEMIPAVPKGVGALARGQTKAFVKQFVSQYGRELSEETMQAFVAEGTKAFFSRIDDEMPNTDLKKLYERPVSETLEAVGPLFVMMAPGHVAGKVSETRKEAAPGVTGQDVVGETGAPVVAKNAPPVTKAELLTPDGASEWAKSNPEASTAIVRQMQRTESLPARGAFESVAPRKGSEKWSAAERNKFGELVKEASNAQGLRVDEAQVQERGDVGQSGEAQGGANLEQQAPQPPGNAQAQVQGQQVAEATKNVRPDLAIPVTPEPLRDVMRQVDAERAAAGVPSVESRAQARTVGIARYNADPVAARQLLLDAGEGKAQFRDTADNYMAVEAMTQAGLDALRIGTPEAMLGAKRYFDAYRDARTQIARELGAGVDPVQSPSQRAGILARSLLTMPEEEQKRYDKAKESGETATVDRMDKQWAERTAALQSAMKSAGIDLGKIEQLVQDEWRTARLLGLMRRMTRGSGWDMAHEYFRNSLLSGFKTQERNFFSNLAFNTLRLTAQRLVEVGINTVRRKPNAAQIGEITHLYAGLLPALTKAARNFMLTYESEMPWLEWQLGRKGRVRVETTATTVPGRTGRAIRIPQRLLLAADQAQKTLVANMEVGAHAYRMAKAEGLSGPDMQRRITELTLDPHSPAWNAALDSANIGTFLEELGSIGKGILKIRNALEPVKPLQWVFVFVTTPVNIVKRGMHYTPFYTPILAAKMALARYQGKTVDWTPELAEQTLGWTMTLAILGSNDPDDPWITGALDGSDPQKRSMSRRTFKPMSVHIGNRSFSYGWLEPFATGIGMMVDTTNAIRRGEPGEIIEAPFSSLVAQVHDKTFLDGVSDIMRVFSVDRGQSVGEKAAGLASSFLTGWVPNIVKEPIRASRSEYPERRIWGKGKDWFDMATMRLAQKTEVLSPMYQEHPARDIWGRTAKTPVSLVPKTDYLWRLFSPVDVGQPDIFVGDRILMNWNAQHPDEEPTLPADPARYFRLRNKTYYFTPAEYDQYVNEAGTLSASIIQNAYGGRDVSRPTEADIKTIETIISKSREIAKQRIVAERIRSGWRPE